MKDGALIDGPKLWKRLSSMLLVRIICTMLKPLFSITPTGRSNRLEFVGCSILFIGIMYLAQKPIYTGSFREAVVFLFISLYFWIVISMLMVIIRRCHDLGQSGWLSFPLIVLYFIEIELMAINYGEDDYSVFAGFYYLFLFGIVIFLLQKGNVGANQYGDEPQDVFINP